ncbi:hypothetical protein GGF50DRAFT_121258 [Schizophyllum commune]
MDSARRANYKCLLESMRIASSTITSSYTERVLLSDHLNQHGINPHLTDWGASGPAVCGAICSRLYVCFQRRNAIGNQQDSYSIHRALFIAIGLYPSTRRLPRPAPEVYKQETDGSLYVCPIIAAIRALIKLNKTTHKGELEIGGKIVLKSRPLTNEDGSESHTYSGIMISTSKVAVEPG